MPSREKVIFMAPQLGRVSVGAKSPLTLGIKEANAGGPAAQKLDKLGIRAIIVQGNAEDMAGAAVFLASPASDFINGVILPVDGGWMAW